MCLITPRSRYKNKRACTDADAASELCCTTTDKQVFSNVWSFRRSDGSDNMLSSNRTEVEQIRESKGWREVCNPVSGPTVFCHDGSMQDGRQGPFMLCELHDILHAVHFD